MGLQSRLDEAAEELTTRQTESESSRSALIAKLQEFFKTSPDSETKSVIKYFQKEIDLLDDRCRASEQAFLEAWKSVGSMADPVAVLESSAEKVAVAGSKLQDSEITIKQLKETMSIYEEEIVTFKKQEKEFNKLQNKLAKYDKNIDETLNERMIEVTEKLTLEADEKIKALEEEKTSAVRKYEDIQNQLEVQRRQLESTHTELFEINQKASESYDARVQEADMLMHDVESWQQRAVLAEKEVEHLKESLKAEPKTVSSDMVDLQHAVEGSLNMFFSHFRFKTSISFVSDGERRMAAKEREIERLVEQLNVSNSQLSSLEASTSSKITNLERDLSQTATQLKETEDTLSKQTDYETLKKELSILKSLEFSQLEESKKPVEVLILERSKALQSENTSLRMDKERLGRALDDTATELADKCKEYERQILLIAELESHVEKLQKIHNRGEAEGRSSVDILRELDSPERQTDSPDQASNLLPIVQAQRERYRQRNLELESEKSVMNQRMQVVQAEVKQLSSDNVKLYEKIRFLQGFKGNASSSRQQEVESRYQVQYEERLDPFTTFSNQERQKRCDFFFIRF